MSCFRPCPLLFTVGCCVLILRAAPAVAQDSSDSSRAASAQSADADRVNLAYVAQATASYTSGDTKVVMINDDRTPRRSRVAPNEAWGTYNRRGTQWVQYDWAQPITTNSVSVYWWADGRGIGLPAACRLKYWNGVEFVEVADTSGLGVEGDQVNTTKFPAITTTRLRLEVDSPPNLSTGIIEWKVYAAGELPKLPSIVEAGPDRSVVLGGKTYLTPAIRSLAKNGTMRWSKASGPGTVTFAQSTVATTSATFSKVGEYELRLSFGEGELIASDTLTVTVDAPPPAKPLGVVYTKRYQIDSPLWNARAKSLITSWIPWCIDQISRPDLQQGAGGIDNFVNAAKKLRGEAGYQNHRGYVFSNAWVHQTVEAMCLGLMVDPRGDQEIITAQEKFRTTLADWIPKILAAQEPDGYMQTAFTLDPRKERWSPRFRADHEGYVAGYFIESAINHYTLTEGSDLRLYNAAKKLADCWVANIGPEPGKREWFDGHQEMEQALVRFGRFVNDMEGGGQGNAYINLAKFLLDCRRNGEEYDQRHAPVQQQYEAVGHAVRAVYNYSGMADVATETGDLDYRSAVMSLWDNMVNKKYYVTGGIGSGETSEGFGPDYSLPHNAYCESCSTCGLIFFQYKMNLSYHDAKYADLYEESMYNALLGATDIPGRNFYYTNPLTGGRRTPWHDCPCCVGNIPRTLLMIPTWTYVTDDHGVYVNLFIGSTIKVENVAGIGVEMVQRTDYPWSGNVSIIINPVESKAFTVQVRVPDRSVSEIYSSAPDSNGIESLAVNGLTVPLDIEKGYARITRVWKSGDQIDLVLPMNPQRVTSIPEVPASRGFVALRRGPLMYNIEAADGNNLNATLDSQSPLAAEWRPELLQGVVVIKGQFSDGSQLTAIPNYARNNRLEGAPATSAVDVQRETNQSAAGAQGSGQRRGRGRGNQIQSNVWIRGAE